TTSRTQGALTSQFQYDPVGRLLAQVAGHLGVGASAEPVIARRYEYDEGGNLLAIDDKRNGRKTYSYDVIGRIMSAVQPDLAERFAFDPAHNLLDDTVASAGRVEGNRVRVFEDKRYDYDAHGNLTEKLSGKHTRLKLEWNAAHQLVKSVVTRNAKEANPTVQTVKYAYDPFGRRIAKRDGFGMTRFVWDGNRLLSEARGKWERTYVYEPDSFVPLAQLDSVADDGDSGRSSEVHHIHTDHLGTPNEVTDQQGEIVWATQYKAWGNVVRLAHTAQRRKVLAALDAESVPSAVEHAQPIRFLGQYHDSETGLHYNRFRYYDADYGRFVSPDPIGLSGGNNLYQYASNPISWIDPLGLTPLEKGMPLPDATKVYRISTEGPYNFNFNSRELDAIATGKLNPPGISLIRAGSPAEAMDIWNNAFRDRPAVSIGEVSAKDIRAAGYDVIHDPSKKGALRENHARLVHPDGVDGFNSNTDKLVPKFSNCRC
ncbi:RHS domain-containing protein, partial [Massilia sp. P8910]|uniref:RHS repeat domain-containing protein n=1 Tax=Massilia antarctica TaxID=2765360 RepID=UPI001E379A1A